MTSRPIADCEACRDALTELVCDELDAHTRSAVLAHTQTCTGCAAELTKLRAVMQAAESLPVEAPSPRVHAAVMLAAREANARRGAVSMQKPARAQVSGFELVRTWLAQVGSWAMSPQVAMASVLLLMLGVGLVALPLGQDREQAALRAAEEPEAAQPAIASGAAAPSATAPEPVEGALKEEAARLDKSAPAESDQYRKSAVTKPAAQRREAAYAAEKSRASQGKSAKGSDDLGALRGLGASGVGAASNETARGGKALSRSKQAFPGAPEAETAGRLEGQAQPTDFASPPPAPKPSLAAPVAQEPSRGRVADAEETSSEAKKDELSSEASLLAQGVSAARNGNYGEAIAVLRPLADKGSPSTRREASLWLARSYRATNDCATAVRFYAPLIASSSAAPAIVTEAADCYERVGDSKQAAVLRSRVQPAKAGKNSAAEPAAAPKP